jgi:hypothetical protein
MWISTWSFPELRPTGDAKTPAERAKLMEDHMKLMQSGMAMLGQLRGGTAGMGGIEPGLTIPILYQSRAIKSSSFNANIRLLASSFLVLE